MTRAAIANLLRRGLWAALEEVSVDDLGRSAWVISPHQDDETLGCGGTILRKVAEGGHVRIAFVSDGSGSHRHLLPVERLRDHRKREARSAASQLGIRQHDVFFLDLEDGRLDELKDEGTEALTALLLRLPADDIYIPYAGESPSDHLAAREIALASIQRAGRAVRVYEYPIWFWNSWPWTAAQQGPALATLRWMRAGIGEVRQLFRDFSHRVHTTGVLERKRAALEEHETQMSRMFQNDDWPILADIAQGAFLDCFFQRYEIFRRSEFVPVETASPAGLRPDTSR